MNPLGHNKLPASARRFAALAAALLAAFFAVSLVRHASAKQLTDSSLVVHEWGTFTSIAGADGAAVEWLPFPAKSDLPTFVEHSASASFKGGLRGTVRMETPVIYFYSPRQTTVSVDVRFGKGLITEWFPHANRVRSSDSHPIILDAKTSGTIAWHAVTITPAANSSFPRESARSHYYAACGQPTRNISFLPWFRRVLSAAPRKSPAGRPTPTAKQCRAKQYAHPLRAPRRQARLSRDSLSRSQRHFERSLHQRHSRFSPQRLRRHPHRPGPLPRRSPRHARNLARLLVRGRQPPLLHRSTPVRRCGPAALDPSCAQAAQQSHRRPRSICQLRQRS